MIAGPSCAETVSLDSALAVALSQNPAIRAASFEVEAARARLGQARAFEPLALSASAGKLGTAVSAEEHESSLRLSQELALPPQRGRAKDLARVEIALAETNRDAVALRVRAETTRAYRRLQADILTIRILTGLRETAADLEQTTNTRLQAGTARYLDVLRPRLERARTENDLIAANRNLHEDRRALNLLMVRDAETPLAPADSLIFTAFTDSLDSLLSQARERPRLRAAQLDVERETASIEVARGSRMPVAGLAVGLDRVPGANGPGFGAEVGLTLPFLPWTDRNDRIDEARAAHGGAQARLVATERSIDTLLRNAYEAARSAERQVAGFEHSLVPDAEDALQAAIQTYQFGQIEALELFETLRLYRSTELEYIQALLNYELALTDLYTAE